MDLCILIPNMTVCKRNLGHMVDLEKNIKENKLKIQDKFKPHSKQITCPL